VHQGVQGIQQLSAEVQATLGDAKTWLSSEGSWVRHESQKSWAWVAEVGSQTTQWTDEQLKAAWKKIQVYTDLTTEVLKNISWIHVLMDPGTSNPVVVIATSIVGAVVVGTILIEVGIPAVLLSPLLAIVEIAEASWGALAGVLASGAVTSNMVGSAG
jgi:hypothetical protein